MGSSKIKPTRKCERERRRGFTYDNEDDIDMGLKNEHTKNLQVLDLLCFYDLYDFFAFPFFSLLLRERRICFDSFTCMIGMFGFYDLFWNHQWVSHMLQVASTENRKFNELN